MILFKTVTSLDNHLNILRAKQMSTGFVPTMGALHKGHLSLIAESKKKSSVTVCSIFVNPTQFNDPADFAKYPVTIENDIYLLEQAGCDILFLPSVTEMYPEGMETGKDVDLGFLDSVLEGSKRPGHFKGVYQVVNRLLKIVQPSLLFMGQKDYQQCMVVQELIRREGFATELRIAPIVRETNGLAMSSRNTRLSEQGRERAAVISQALLHIKDTLAPGDPAAGIQTAEKMILDAGFDSIDYVAVADAATLAPVTRWDGHTPVVALVAAFTEGVRLIDNMILT